MRRGSDAILQGFVRCFLQFLASTAKQLLHPRRLLRICVLNGVRAPIVGDGDDNPIPASLVGRLIDWPERIDDAFVDQRVQVLHCGRIRIKFLDFDDSRKQIVECVFRLISATCSDSIRPPIPMISATP